MVRLVSWRDIDSGPLQVIVDDHTQYRSRVRHGHECLAYEIPRTDCFERSETVVTGQDYHQGLFDEKTERQVWHPSFPSKKSCIDCSLQKCIREQRRVLTRNHFHFHACEASMPAEQSMLQTRYYWLPQQSNEVIGMRWASDRFEAHA
jgi:hypothetical protein